MEHVTRTVILSVQGICRTLLQNLVVMLKYITIYGFLQEICIFSRC